jgi:hypothetical protein
MRDLPEVDQCPLVAPGACFVTDYVRTRSKGPEW